MSQHFKQSGKNVKKWRVCRCDKFHGKHEKHISLPNGDIYIYGGEKELRDIPKLIVDAVNAFLIPLPRTVKKEKR